jgi:AcrR family transcriptional regulator
MTHAALYAYFPSKAALYQATCDHTQSLLLTDYIAAIQGKPTLREQLREILLVGAEAHNKDPSITGILGAIPMEIRRHPELAELLLDRQNATLQLLAKAFAAAQQRGEITDKASPEDQVIAIMGAAVGISLLNSGLGNSNVMDSMQVFIDLIEARFFQ